MQKKQLSTSEKEKLMDTLKIRFENNKHRHPKLNWKKIQERLENHKDKLWSLQQMETTGGEPDVVAEDKKSGAIIFFDCVAESPKGRRSVCYDPEALASRKEHKPKHSAVGLAKEMGIKLMTEEQYRQLQSLGDVDLKTSSWVLTPTSIREKGGAVFCDKRYGQVFLYHNGAESYYASRGFRGVLEV